MTKDAKLEYKGKSKDVYGLPNGNVLLVFGDAFTGTDGKEDPGGNTNVGVKAGLGRKNLEITAFLYNLINSELGIPTHIVSVDLKNNTMEAKRTAILGGGLEFISRNKVWGSFLKRNPQAKEGEDMTDENGFPFVEVSTKDDLAGDPIFTREQLINRKMLSAKDYDTAAMYTRQITKYLTEIFKQVGMELIDMKMEFGKDTSGNLLLSDEISPGAMRALIDGKLATKDELHNRILKYKPLKKAKPQVAVVMGSDSDLDVMNGAIQMLDKFGITYEVDFVSAHRTPEKVTKLGNSAAKQGLFAIIAGAGGAAHLPGMLAAETVVPVIGVPVVSKSLSSDGTDALLSIVQMPAGVPVATVGINRAENAGILAAQIVGASNPSIRAKLAAYKKELNTMVYNKSAKLKSVGHEEYLKQRGKKKHAQN